MANWYKKENGHWDYTNGTYTHPGVPNCRRGRFLSYHPWHFDAEEICPAMWSIHHWHHLDDFIERMP